LVQDVPHDAETLQRCVWMLAPLHLITFGQEPARVAAVRQPTPVSVAVQSSPSRVTAPAPMPENAPAAKPVAAPVDFAAEAKQLQARYAQMQTQNLFDVLGVTREADPGAIKVAYLKAARNYHPDTVPAGAPAILAKVKADIFGLVGEANRTLSDVALRQQYIAQLETGSASSQVDVATILKGEELFHKGRLFMQNRKYQEAAKLFDEAVECNPEEGEFYAWRAYAKFLIAPDKKQALPEVMRDLNRCLAKNANVAAAYYFLGFIAKTNGDAAAALANFKKCVAIDPKHIDAQREIRLMAK
jgi:tetratricopeptide (TPR) repeat protein